ncbi:nitrate reductase cytochrome c-type subunit [Azospirillum halopraeferens]|uniref:nitrate reductase cytochrome c-type subunit n=1 Tax=Azospirillum halopraeferens TaxID=34010 RepID=UPI00041E56B6|nr:nitrate reductase cytochrome c-type subunit [Azospirillum halopraeferens]
MKSHLKLIAAAAGMALVSAAVLPAGAFTADLQSLRGAVEIPATDQAPSIDIFKYQEGGSWSRNFRQQPPLIPHKVEKYQVDRNVNQCVSCHDWSNAKRMRAPQISETHYLDRDGNRLDSIAGTRWFCTQCHVPQTDAKPLVENEFAPAPTLR